MTAQTNPYDETRPRNYRTPTMILTMIIKLLLCLATQGAAAIVPVDNVDPIVFTGIIDPVDSGQDDEVGGEAALEPAFVVVLFM